MTRHHTILWALLTCVGSLLPAADLPRLLGTVTHVVDGDTMDVTLSTGPIRVRLHGIDAPERGQPWGKEATKVLTDLAGGQKVELEPFEQDRYERLIARVFIGGREINGELIRQGQAWAYRQHMTKSDSPYCALESSARGARRGLWSQPAGERMPPWMWRKRPRPIASPEEPTVTEQSCLMEIGKKR